MYPHFTGSWHRLAEWLVCVDLGLATTGLHGPRLATKGPRADPFKISRTDDKEEDVLSSVMSPVTCKS